MADLGDGAQDVRGRFRCVGFVAHIFVEPLSACPHCFAGRQTPATRVKVGGSPGIKFLYDADGRLTAKRVNGAIVSWFLWDGANLLAELNGTASAAVTEYSYYGMDAPHAVIKQPLGTRLYARMDGLGDVLALMDTSGSIQTTYAYDDWGKLTSSSDLEGFNGTDRARWKGALWLGPELDLYYMRARWYEPQTGRFLSEDPIGLAGGMNPLVFAGSNPVNGSDPSGLDCPIPMNDTKPCDIGGWGVAGTDPWSSSVRAGIYGYYATFWDYYNPAADGRITGRFSYLRDGWRRGLRRLGRAARAVLPTTREEIECSESVAKFFETAILDASFFVGVFASIRLGQLVTRTAAMGLSLSERGLYRVGGSGAFAASRLNTRLLELESAQLRGEYAAGVALASTERSTGILDFLAGFLPGPATYRSYRHAFQACDPNP